MLLSFQCICRVSLHSFQWRWSIPLKAPFNSILHSVHLFIQFNVQISSRKHFAHNILKTHIKLQIREIIEYIRTNSQCIFCKSDTRRLETYNASIETLKLLHHRWIARWWQNDYYLLKMWTIRTRTLDKGVRRSREIFLILSIQKMKT